MRAGRQRTVQVLGIIFFFAAMSTAQAEPCEKSVGRLVSLQGTVEARPSNQSVWQAAKLNDKFCPGDAIRTGARSRAAMVLANETIVRLDQLTTLTLSGLDDKSTSWVDLLSGMAHFLSRTPRALKVKTPYINAGVEGTEFVVRAGPSEGSVSVLEGRVLAENTQGSASLVSGESAAAAAGQAPVKRLVVQPRDAVQWSLYFPPLFEGSALTGSESWAEPARRSATSYLAGDSAAAFAAIASVPNSVNDARFFNYRAGLLLSVGRVDEAQSDISRSLQLSADNAHALALQSIVALARNDYPAALDLARKANTRDPASVSAWVALSYAQQAAFDLDAARASMQQAVLNDPNNALAWSRLAELWLALGDLEKAQGAADRAVSINANIARTQTVRGFASLTRIKTANAQRAFEMAISQDSADPLARLGLGLALIRQGHLDAGRREIEIAAALDPNNALIRSYLGKAYYEEKRNRLATAQLDMAKLLDPNDPTPWLYDAIRKQTENRPVESLNDLQKSIELNDNRAVFRSSLLLDQDLAARSASLGRIYNDLGFSQLALLEGWKSINTDRSNYSAHRLLADSYASLPRHETARVSELLQAQLLQPLNLTPIQPQLAESNLGILGSVGSVGASFNEYNSLFVRNSTDLQLNGVVGGDVTRANDVVIAGLHGNLSYSLGQFHYQSEGFRVNNDQDKDIVNAFFQMQLSPQTSAQMELRYKDAVSGDLVQRFDPTNFSDTLRDKRTTTTARFGLHHALATNSDFLVSLIHQKVEISSRQEVPPFGTFGSDTEDIGKNLELQHLFRGPNSDIAVGIGAADATDVSSEIAFSASSPSLETQTRHKNAYAYYLVKPAKSVSLLAGLSGDWLDNTAFGRIPIERDQVNPKLGLTWTPLPSTVVRVAGFRMLKRTLVGDQTIEPTQIAGFNQLYDDPLGSDSQRFGIALEHRLAPNLYTGIELTRRRLDVPFIFTDFLLGTEELRTSKWKEQFGRTYLYWAPHLRVSVSAEFIYEQFARGNDPNDFFGTELFSEVTTQSVPLAIRYFDPSGFVAMLKATRVNQEGIFIDQTSPSFFVPGEDRFWTVDTSVGYRLPHRHGYIGLEVKNLRDQEFRFQDTSPGAPMYYPRRLVMGRVVLAF